MDVPGSRYFLASDSICMVELLGLGTKRLLCQNFVCVRSERTKMFEMLCASGVCVCRVDIVCTNGWMVFSTQLNSNSVRSQAHTHFRISIYINFVVLSFDVILCGTHSALALTYSE